MGWLFGHYERSTLIKHLTDGNGVKTIKHCLVGNNLWCVHEHDEQRWACLYLLRGSPRIKDDPCNWGYKDVDETMGPYETSFPYTWLELLTPTDSQYANEWRSRVKARGEKLRKIVVGSKWQGYGHTFEIIERRSPTSFRAKDEYGETWRLTSQNISAMENQ